MYLRRKEKEGNKNDNDNDDKRFFRAKTWKVSIE